MSTMHEPIASAGATPPSTAARTAIRMLPTCEKGSTSEAASRRSRPQMYAGARRAVSAATTHQARPSGMNRRTWAARARAKPRRPMGLMADRTERTLKAATTAVATRRPTTSAATAFGQRADGWPVTGSATVQASPRRDRALAAHAQPVAPPFDAFAEQACDEYAKGDQVAHGNQP